MAWSPATTIHFSVPRTTIPTVSPDPELFDDYGVSPKAHAAPFDDCDEYDDNPKEQPENVADCWGSNISNIAKSTPHYR